MQVLTEFKLIGGDKIIVGGDSTQRRTSGLSPNSYPDFGAPGGGGRVLAAAAFAAAGAALGAGAPAGMAAGETYWGEGA